MIFFIANQNIYITFVVMLNNLNEIKMNIFTEILEKSASQLGYAFKISQSSKSEASYLLISCYSNSKLNDVYSCLGVRLANHEAMTANSKNYEIQLDLGFWFDFSSNTFSTTWGIDEDGDFSESALEDERFFKNECEIITYMSECLVIKLKSKI